jgi:hypothetical protein
VDEKDRREENLFGREEFAGGFGYPRVVGYNFVNEHLDLVPFIKTNPDRYDERIIIIGD